MQTKTYNRIEDRKQNKTFWENSKEIDMNEEFLSYRAEIKRYMVRKGVEVPEFVSKRDAKAFAYEYNDLFKYTFNIPQKVVESLILIWRNPDIGFVWYGHNIERSFRGISKLYQKRENGKGNGFTTSLIDQIERWANEKNKKYPFPLSQKQNQYIIKYEK